MKCDKNSMLLYAVTDRAWVGKYSLYEQVELALKGGVTCVQLREKDLDEQEFLNEAVEIGELCKQYGVPFFVNDNVDIAVKSNADGVHVGQHDMSVPQVRQIVGDKMILGVSAQTVEQAVRAANDGADYIGVGAVFSTSTKDDADAVSKDVLRDICSAVDIPVVAIGGINKSNIGQLSGTGIDGVAVVSAIFGANDIVDECRLLGRMARRVVKGEQMKTALSIAGSDCSGGAGIQADLKTMTMNGVYGMSAITALTAQNTTGVRAILESTPEFLGQQIDAVFEDIHPDAVKIGMVSSVQLIHVIADRLKYYGANNVVVDPVMVATSGSALIENDATKTMVDELFPLATVVTPNVPEAEVLADMRIESKEDMIEAARKIGDAHGCAVLIKGGHSVNDANDLLYANGESVWFIGKRVNNPNTHGTGCTLSSAIASNLAKGLTLAESVQKAKEYITGALEDMLDLGQGSGPMNHAFELCGIDYE